MVGPDTLAVAQPTALAIRWAHLLALAVALGGAVVLTLVDDAPPELARRYEAAFWLSMGVVVVTGIGNVGALAPAVPGPDASWGRTFTLKLVAVLSLVGFSTLRTGLVRRNEPDGSPTRLWYAVTAGWLAVIVALAVVMVRG